MNRAELFERYQRLQNYVGWSQEDVEILVAVADLLRPCLPALVDDFYEEIERNPDVRKVITGGKEQITRLKGTLRQWLEELLGGNYDSEYVARRWRVGWRHVEIGLDQVYTNVAMSRLRMGLTRNLEASLLDDPPRLARAVLSLNRLIDLDLAIIEDAYQAEYTLRLQRQERLATIGQVAGGVAHELRNPLNVVKTSVYFLLNARQASEQKKQEHLQRIERHVVLADGVITALSNFARLPVPNQQPFSLAKCVSEALEFNAFPIAIEVVVDCPPDLPHVVADMDQIRIVLGNLIRNAREAMSQGGGRLTLTARLVDGEIELDVTDTGVGIPANLLGRVMEPLFSTKARGLGLGLAIARAILEKNRGSLRVSSVEGQGSTFTLRLPAEP